MKAVILGCGRLGKRVALKMMKEKKYSVVVIDRKTDALDSLGKDFEGKVMQADGSSVETYLEVMAELPEVFIALTSDDNTNLMAAQIARQKYKVAKVIARVDDPIRAKAFEELGIETFCPTVLSEKKISKMVEKQEKEKEDGE